MLALQHAPVAGLITACAPALPGDEIIMQQFEAAGRMPPEILDSCRRMLATLKKGGHIDSVHRGLLRTFRPSVQGYLASWIQYDPRVEMAKVTVPALVLEGTRDLIADTTDAALLVAARPGTKEVVIDGMNYMFKQAPPDRNANIDTYSKPGLPVKKS